MVLVTAAMNNHDAEEDQADVRDAANNKPQLPTIVQLYQYDATVPPLMLQATTPPHANAAYATLTYQPVVVEALEQQAVPEKKGLRATTKPVKKDWTLVRPDFGVWNVQYMSGHDNNALPDQLLTQVVAGKAVRHKSAQQFSFVFKIDLGISMEALGAVEGVMTRLQQALVRHLMQVVPLKHDTRPLLMTATTSLYNLRTVTFGLGVDDDESQAKLTQAEPDASDKSVLVPLMLVIDVQQGQDDLPYNVQQARHLLLYHLRRYAHQLLCGLCFVSLSAASSSSTIQTMTPTSQPVLDTKLDVATLLRDWATGVPVWEKQQDTNVAVSGNAEDIAAVREASPMEQPRVYGPGHYQEELMDTLLRTAQYPGQWDAAKQSVWRILTPPSLAAAAASTPDRAKASSNSPSNKTTVVPDQDWLAELQSSLASVAELKSPAPSAKKGATTGTPAAAAAGTPADKKDELSSFFGNLMASPSGKKK